MKKAVLIILTLLLLSLLSSCAPAPEGDVPVVRDTASDKLQIVATLFPQYDFARHIAGDKAEVTLLLPPGVESHSYEPKPSDIIKINKSDLFLYTGEFMEPWAQKLIDGSRASDSTSMVVNVSQGIELIRTGESSREHHHDEDLDDNDHEHDPGHLYDPHIWTDPNQAKMMAVNIVDALCSLDPANAEYYRENGARFSAELDALDAEFREIVAGGTRKEILFGSRFALFYFTERYGLDYEAAFDSCSSETEPSAKAVAELIEEIKENKVPVIYYAEIENPKVAESISAETGAKLLLFHSCHNVTREEFESGATYLSLMKQNAENLREGLE